MNTFNQVTLAALTALTLGIAVQAEGRPEGRKGPGGPGGRGGRAGGPPSPERMVEGYAKVAVYDTNKDGALDESEKTALSNAIAAGKFELPPHRPAPEGAAPDGSKILERMTRMYSTVAVYDSNHDGVLDDTEQAALKTAADNGTLPHPGGRPGGPRGPHGPHGDKAPKA
jgi:hypothetical protein